MDITVRLITPDSEKTVIVPRGSLISHILGIANHPIDLPCGGRGVCKKCRVQVSGGLSQPTPQERELLGAELENGIRLACMTRAMQDVTITLSKEHSERFETAVTAGATRATGGSRRYRRWGVAVDIGTTTLAGALCYNGAVVARTAAKNPQTAYGADVISRVGLAVDGRGDELTAAVRRGVNSLIADLCAQASITPLQLDSGVITGNTAMLYLLTSKNPKSLSCAPFAADWLAGELCPAEWLGLNMGDAATVYLPRCIGAFVGADITCALLAVGMTELTDTALLCDIGTNGELALWHNGQLTCCSTAAGPAFEGAGIVCGMLGRTGAIDHVTVVDGDIAHTVIGGGIATGICGSGVVDTVAAMLAVGALDETGRITPEVCTCAERISQRSGDLLFAIEGDVGLYGKDVRAVQLAKSAIRAGMETLIVLAGLAPEQVTRLYVAGGFGSYLSLEAAAAIGLISPALHKNAQPIGNASLAGAVMLLEDEGLAAHTVSMSEIAQLVDLGSSSFFMEQYMEQMGF